jgi:broad specificity phosphatase PhoE
VTLFLLVRHGLTEAVGKIIAGRLPGFPLNEKGRAEAAALAASLSALKLDAIHSSPLERARETAAIVAAPHGSSVVENEALTDIDFGRWNAQPISHLESIPAFQRFNQHRAFCGIPSGERVSQVQARMVDALAEVAEAHPSGTVVVVSHGDPIRLAIGFYLGLGVDLVQRLEIGTGSVSALELSEQDAKLHALNARDVRMLPL